MAIEINWQKLALYYWFVTMLINWCRCVSSKNECVVSTWKDWSDCEGNCEYAQRFRNRDVLRAPFPERDVKGADFVLAECPRLYEVERCVPKECGEESPFIRGPPIGTIKFHSRSAPVHSDDEDGRQQRINFRKDTTRGRAKMAEDGQEDPFGMGKKMAGISIHPADGGRTPNRHECPYPNPNCCKVTRQKCPNKTKPKMLIRWYRKKDEQFCRPYRYPFCAVELSSDRTFVNESECLDVCFSEVEKAVLPGFRII